MTGFFSGYRAQASHQPRGERAARLDQEGARAHGRIADLEFEHLLRCRVWPEPLERRLQRVPHDRLGQTARRVVAAGATTFVGRLQQRRARRRDLAAGRAALVDDRPERRSDAGHIRRRGQRLADLVGDRVAIGLFLEEFGALRSLLCRQRRHVDEHRRPVVLAGADRDRRAGTRLDREAHHRLVDAADLLDVEGAVGQLLAVEAQQQVENAQDAAVRHDRRRRRISRRVLSLQKRKRIRIEQLAAAAADPAGAVATMDEAEERQQAGPCATPLVHRVGMMRGIVEQAGIERADAIALIVKRPRLAVGARRDEVAILGIEQKHEAEEDGQQSLIEMLWPARRQSLDASLGRRNGDREAARASAPSTCAASLVETSACASRLALRERRQAAVRRVIVQPERGEDQLETAEHWAAANVSRASGAETSASRWSRRAARG